MCNLESKLLQDHLLHTTVIGTLQEGVPGIGIFDGLAAATGVEPLPLNVIVPAPNASVPVPVKIIPFVNVVVIL